MAFSKGVQAGLGLGKAFNLGKIRRDEEDLSSQVLSQGVGGDAFKKFAAINPLRAIQLKGALDTDDLGFEAVFQDAAMAKHLLNIDPSGNRLGEFLNNRIQTGQQQGRNMEHTQGLLTTLSNNGADAAKIELDSFLDIPNQLKARKAVKQKGEGGLVFDPNTGKYSLDEVAAQRIDELKAKQDQAGKLGLKDRRIINSDVTGFIKQAISIKTTAADLKKLKNLGTGAASISAIFKFMKANDPTSTVREGEFATAETSGGVPEAIRNFYNKIVSGERIDEGEIQKFIDVSEALTNSAIESAQTTVGGYINTFEDTLSPSFASKVLKRIPTKFDIRAQGAGANQASIKSLSDEDLFN